MIYTQPFHRMKIREKLVALEEEPTLNYLMFELEQAREDHRSSLDHISQITTSGVAVLAIVFALASLLTSEPIQSITGVITGDPASQISLAANLDVRYEEQGFDQYIAQVVANPLFYATVIVCLIFGVLFYFSSIGLERGFRYHYMRDLEDKIRELLIESGASADLPCGWNATSSPLVTLNLAHSNTLGSRLYLFSFGTSLLCIFIVCAAFGIAFLGGIRETPGGTAFICIAAAFLLLFVGGFLFGTTNSKRIYDNIKEEVVMRHEGCAESKRLSSEKTKWGEALLYYLYPRPGDALKALFVLEGSLFAIAAGAYLNVDIQDKVVLTIITLLVIDVLVYQARYQINDIRGAEEDPQNPQAKNKKRMPRINGSLELSVRISLCVALAKLALAGAIIVAVWINIGQGNAIAFIVGSALVLLLAAFYESAREKASRSFQEIKDDTNRALLSRTWLVLSGPKRGDNRDFSDAPSAENASTSSVKQRSPKRIKGVRGDRTYGKLVKMSRSTNFLVCLGYPLRTAIGVFAVFPNLIGALCQTACWSIATALVLLLVATALFGESFVMMTWSLEASSIYRTITGKEKDGNKKTKGFYKPHIAFQGWKLGNDIGLEYPLRDHPHRRTWNVCAIASLVAMAVAMLAAAYGLGGTSLTDVLLTVIAVLLPIIVFLSAAIATTAACPWRLSSETRDLMRIDGLISCGILLLATMVLTICFLESRAGVFLVLVAASSIYALIYLWFSSTNYAEMNANFAAIAIQGLIGSKTAESIKRERESKEQNSTSDSKQPGA